MISVKGLYDGEKIKLLEKVDTKTPQKVIITFLESGEEKALSQRLYKLAETGGSFEFLKDSEEDIYSDSDLKVDYRK